LPACQKFCLGFLQRGPAPARDDPVLRIHVHRDGPEPAQLGFGISVLIQSADGMAILNDDVIEPVAIGRGRQAGRRRVSIGLGFMDGEPSVSKVPVFPHAAALSSSFVPGGCVMRSHEKPSNHAVFAISKKCGRLRGESAMPLDESKRCTA
jgi:hypothetical protein